MPRKGYAEKKRLRAGLPPVKPGKVGWVHGTKLKFFAAYKKDYLTAAELKKTGQFYDQMAHLYLEKYGYHTVWNDDLEDDADIADDVDPNEDVNSLSVEEAEMRAQYFTVLRNKIGAWYKAQYGGSVSKTAKPMTFKKLFDKPELGPPAPVKPRVLHYYSRRFYDEHIKDRVTARWAAVSARWAEHSRVERPPGVPAEKAPSLVAVRSTVTRAVWDGETEAFKKEVMAALKNEHDVAKEAYEKAVAGEAPTTPEARQIGLDNLAYYLQPFADNLHEHFGLNVTFMLAGPIPDRGGRIEVRSIHAGTTNGLVPRIWSDFDRAGFDAAQRSMVEFTHQCFTEAECRARSLNGMAMVQEDAVPAPPAGTPGSAVPNEQAEGATSPAQESAVHGPVPAQSVVPSLVPSLAEMLAHNELTTFDQPINPYLDSNPLPPNLYLDENPFPPDPYFDEEPFPSSLFPNLSDADLLSFGAAEPQVGKALAAEIAQLPENERAAYLGGLRQMDARAVEKENEAARTRLVMARLARGIPAEIVFEMSSDAEEDYDEAGPDQAQQGPDGAAGRMPESAPDANRSKEGVAPAPGGATPAPAPPPPHARLRPRPNGSLQRPEVHPDTEGPLRNGVQRAGANVEGGGTQPASGFWEAQDISKWDAELIKAFTAFGRGREWGGEGWERAVGLLVDLEQMWGFPAKGRLAMPVGDQRPGEVHGFIGSTRRWSVKVPLMSAVGPRGVEETFSCKWWGWWELIQPPARCIDGNEWKPPAEVDDEEGWEEIGKMHGRNGILMCLGALLWWGEGAAADKEGSSALLADWRLAVEDFSAVLAEVVKRGPSIDSEDETVAVAKEKPKKKAGPKKKAATPKASARPKRKAVTSSAGEKENERPKKRPRRT
ncbi:hypothetical protein DFH07DRAFT_948268 [Mycena maculata]|uniref:Uncharacterized protein n=1 Tax=Mycena maculata TaxID=230809 RepID=A0AAD7P2S2_9AGAR|nr:hypothetical protein DFH07DRAFT_948268 [Mycena maculata]